VSHFECPKRAWFPTQFPGARRREYTARLLLIGSMTATCGAQDVNDPRTALGPHRGARGGVVHVLGSVSMLIGNCYQGRHRTPPHLSRGEFAQPLGSKRRSCDGFRERRSPERVHRGCASGLRNRVEARVDAVRRLVPFLFPPSKSSAPRTATAHQGGEMVIGMRQNYAFDLRTTRREGLANNW
jgi:hypothetical protein